jgi:hypothetical protein
MYVILIIRYINLLISLLLYVLDKKKKHSTNSTIQNTIRNKL